MIVDCIADLHGYYPELQGGDLLIVAGDLTSDGEYYSYIGFCQWLEECDYREKIVIAGNHDNGLIPGYKGVKFGYDFSGWATYLCDSGTEFEGLKIWGAPWTAYFEGINPNCMAFTMNYGCDTDDWLAEKWALIPDDTDILVTHGPPYGILDTVRKPGPFSHKSEQCVGSESLLKRVFDVRPKLHVFGHIPQAYGQYDHIPRAGASEKLGVTSVKFINCSHVNEHYKPVNKPIRIIL